MPPTPAVVWPYRIRHHWVVLFRLPSLWGWIGLAVLGAIGITSGWLGWLPLLILLVSVMAFRIQEWRAEIIELDQLTIRRASGVRETTVSRALIRVDRISGLVVTRTVPGKLLGYGSLHLEAPGDHPGFGNLHRIQDPDTTFLLIQALMFRIPSDTDPDDIGSDARHTAPLPALNRPGTGTPSGRPR